VAGLLALVAHALAAGLGGAVARQMANLAAVVALLALSAVTCDAVSQRDFGFCHFHNSRLK